MGENGRVRIVYPFSGVLPVSEIAGDIRWYRDEDGATPWVEIPDRPEALMLDPRCVIIDQDTQEYLYSPRATLRRLPEWVTSWLVEHPEWPHSP